MRMNSRTSPPRLLARPHSPKESARTLPRQWIEEEWGIAGIPGISSLLGGCLGRVRPGSAPTARRRKKSRQTSYVYHVYTGRKVPAGDPQRPLRGRLGHNVAAANAYEQSHRTQGRVGLAARGIGPRLEPPRRPKGLTKPHWPTASVEASVIRYVGEVRRAKLLEGRMFRADGKTSAGGAGGTEPPRRLKEIGYNGVHRGNRSAPSGSVDVTRGGGGIGEMLSALPVLAWAEHGVMEGGDVVVTIEHCHGCHGHRMTTRHDSEVYLRHANAVKALLVESLRESPIRLAVVLKRAVLRPKGSRGTRGVRGSLRRVGAFEVQVAALHPSGAGPLHSRVVHSKLTSGHWPRLGDQRLPNRVKTALISWGFSPRRRCMDREGGQTSGGVERGAHASEGDNGGVGAGAGTGAEPDCGGGRGRGEALLANRGMRLNVSWEFDHREPTLADACTPSPQPPRIGVAPRTSGERDAQANAEPARVTLPTDTTSAKSRAPDSDDADASDPGRGEEPLSGRAGNSMVSSASGGGVVGSGTTVNSVRGGARTSEGVADGDQGNQNAGQDLEREARETVSTSRADAGKDQQDGVNASSAVAAVAPHETVSTRSAAGDTVSAPRILDGSSPRAGRTARHDSGAVKAQPEANRNGSASESSLEGETRGQNANAHTVFEGGRKGSDLRQRQEETGAEAGDHSTDAPLLPPPLLAREDLARAGPTEGASQPAAVETDTGVKTKGSSRSPSPDLGDGDLGRTLVLLSSASSPPSPQEFPPATRTDATTGDHSEVRVEMVGTAAVDDTTPGNCAADGIVNAAHANSRGDPRSGYDAIGLKGELGDGAVDEGSGASGAGGEIGDASDVSSDERSRSVTHRNGGRGDLGEDREMRLPGGSDSSAISGGNNTSREDSRVEEKAQPGAALPATAAVATSALVAAAAATHGVTDPEGEKTNTSEGKTVVAGVTGPADLCVTDSRPSQEFGRDCGDGLLATAAAGPRHSRSGEDEGDSGSDSDGQVGEVFSNEASGAERPSGDEEEYGSDFASQEDPTTQTPSVEEPSYEEPSYEEPSFEEPSFEEPSFEEPSFEEPSFEEHCVEEPSVEDSSIIEPSIKKPFIEEEVGTDGIIPVAIRSSSPLPDDTRIEAERDRERTGQGRALEVLGDGGEGSKEAEGDEDYGEDFDEDDDFESASNR